MIFYARNPGRGTEYSIHIPLYCTQKRTSQREVAKGFAEILARYWYHKFKRAYRSCTPRTWTPSPLECDHRLPGQAHERCTDLLTVKPQLPCLSCERGCQELRSLKCQGIFSLGLMGAANGHRVSTCFHERYETLIFRRPSETPGSWQGPRTGSSRLGEFGLYLIWVFWVCSTQPWLSWGQGVWSSALASGFVVQKYKLGFRSWV